MVRWRLLPELSLAGALRVSLAVSLSFLAGWAVVTALVVLATEVEIAYLHQAAIGILAAATLSCAILIAQPKSLPALPGIGAVFSIVALAFIDTIFASAALFILLPPDIIIAPTALFTAFSCRAWLRPDRRHPRWRRPVRVGPAGHAANRPPRAASGHRAGVSHCLLFIARRARVSGSAVGTPGKANHTRDNYPACADQRLPRAGTRADTLAFATRRGELGAPGPVRPVKPKQGDYIFNKPIAESCMRE